MGNSGPFLNNILRNSVNDNWLIASILILALAYVGIKLIYGRYWKRYRQALLYSQEAHKLIQEKNALLMQAAISINILAVFSIGLFAFLFSKKFNLFVSLGDGFWGWMLATVFVVLIVGGKYLLNILLGRAGDNSSAANQINHQWMINFKNFGFFLLPFSIISAFIAHPLDDLFYYLGLSVLILLLIMNYIKGFFILLQYRISIFYGILYLCTLEILPVLIIWKVIR